MPVKSDKCMIIYKTSIPTAHCHLQPTVFKRCRIFEVTMNKKGNKGYQDTDKRICDFVLDKMKKYPLHDISVKEVCGELEINRSTFYAHFQDIYAVAEAIADTYNQELLDKCGRIAKSGDSRPQNYLLAVLEHIRDHQVFYRSMFSEDMSTMMDKDMLALRRVYAEPLMRSLNIPENRISFYFTYAQGGFFAVTEMWLKNGCNESPEEMSGIIRDLNPDFEKYWPFN